MSVHDRVSYCALYAFMDKLLIGVIACPEAWICQYVRQFVSGAMLLKKKNNTGSRHTQARMNCRIHYGREVRLYNHLKSRFTESSFIYKKF